MGFDTLAREAWAITRFGIGAFGRMHLSLKYSGPSSVCARTGSASYICRYSPGRRSSSSVRLLVVR